MFRHDLLSGCSGLGSGLFSNNSAVIWRKLSNFGHKEAKRALKGHQRGVVKITNSSSHLKGILEEQRFAKIEEDTEEQKEFYKKGLERIKEYYSLPEDKRGEKTGLKNPPHDILMKRAGALIFLGSESLEKRRYIGDEPIGYILMGIGAEILLKAIILKEDPNYFIENIRGEKTLSFQQCSEKSVELLPKTFTLKQEGRMKEVLELIQQKRNNLVHLGFHQMGIYREDFQIAHVLEFLSSYFFGENAKSVIEKLREFKEKRKVISGIDYEPVEFEGWIC